MAFAASVGLAPLNTGNGMSHFHSCSQESQHLLYCQFTPLYPSTSPPSVVPGWHTTIFPPYFVAGAIFSGFAMVLTLMVITRKVLNLEDYVTVDHIESMNKIIILTGSIVGCAYLTELFTAWYSQNPYEQYAFANRALGPYYWSYWSMMTCNVISPQLFWVRKLRRNVWFTFFMSIVINCGMWFERFVIIVTSLHRDFIPSSWAMYSPTVG